MGVQVEQGWYIEAGWIIGNIPVLPTFLVTQNEDIITTEFEDPMITEE